MTEFARFPQIEDVILVQPKRFIDDRGYFSEVYHEYRYKDHGINCTFVQDNHSLSLHKGVVRGLHFQTPPAAQAKLVRCTRGAIIDYAVDIRHSSPTFGSYVSAELTAENGHQLFVPVGFAHAFCTLEDETEVQYKVSTPYVPECDSGVAFNDPEIGIDWPYPVGKLLLSEKDKNLPTLAQMPAHDFAQ